MNATEAISRLRRQSAAIEALTACAASSPQFTKWCRDTEIAIERIFGSSTRHLVDFKDIQFFPMTIGVSTDEHHFYIQGLEEAKAVLSSMVEELEEYAPSSGRSSAPTESSMKRLERICEHFHAVTRQLRARHASRPTLEIEDEYDVQDLLHALLQVDFDDIRPEEWTPSYAGGASRIDFLLKREEAVIEVKKTRKGLEARQVGEQLIVDIARYAAHPGCKHLVCFIYDPEGRIGNPRGLETDLTRTDGAPTVRVFIRPLH
jgi:hypothetical protein